MTSVIDWTGRVGDVWAAEWERTERSFAALVPHLDEAILSVAPDRGRALDIGCGVGSTSLALAAAWPEVAVVGVDLSAGLIARAVSRPVTPPAPRFVTGDALAVARDEGPFDLFVSRHGVMFFADPVAAFTDLARSASAGAALAFSCFDDPARNGFATIADEATGTVSAPIKGYRPGPFGFADLSTVATILDAAGWEPHSSARVPFDYVVGEGADPVADALAFLTRIGPCARAVADSAAADRTAIVARLSAALARYRADQRVVLPASAWIWRAHKREAR